MTFAGQSWANRLWIKVLMPFCCILNLRQAFQHSTWIVDYGISTWINLSFWFIFVSAACCYGCTWALTSRSMWNHVWWTCIFSWGCFIRNWRKIKMEGTSALPSSNISIVVKLLDSLKSLPLYSLNIFTQEVKYLVDLAVSVKLDLCFSDDISYLIQLTLHSYVA